ncbi:MAG: thioredoxin [Gammaproteobacteria bacterium]|nr:MAG: thioredoxin [Gammaproteobacteria bacterium]
MATINLTQDNFTDTINNNDIVVVDFWADWCGPCKSFAPVYEKVSQEHKNVVFAKVDTQAQQELAGSFNIRSIPTLMVFREKTIIFQQAGALPESSLTELITSATNLDMKQVKADIEKKNQEKNKS